MAISNQFFFIFINEFMQITVRMVFLNFFLRNSYITYRCLLKESKELGSLCKKKLARNNNSNHLNH